MSDTYLRLLPYFQNMFALIAPTSYMLSLGKNCPNLNFHCPICQSHSMALLPGWQACPTVHMNWSISTHVNQFMYSQSIEEGNSVKNWLVTNLNQISVQCLLPFQSYIWKKMQSIFESFLNTCEERLNSKNPKLRRILSRINPNSQPIVSRVNRYHYTDNVAVVSSVKVSQSGYAPLKN